MMLFHPRLKRVIAILEAESREHGGPGKVGEGEPKEYCLHDSVQRHLLGGGFILRSDGQAAQLWDAMGETRWSGGVAGIRAETSEDLDPALRVLIGLRLDEWRLGAIARVQTQESQWRIKTDNQALSESQPHIWATIIAAKHLGPGGIETEGVFIDIQAKPEHERAAKSVQLALLETGGISCPWPFMLLAQRGAVAAGWIDPERIWVSSQKWSDLLKPLVHLLKGIRDDSDPACVQEARTQIKQLRLLIDLSRQLQGKSAKSQKHQSLKELHDELGALRGFDLLLQFLNGQARGGQWVGINGALQDCAGWSPAMAELLKTETEALRAAEHRRLRAGQRYISEPELFTELGADWPRFPRIEKDDPLAQGRWRDNLENRLKKLGREISRLETQAGNGEIWAEIRRRCRKINRMLEVCPHWANQTEIQFLRHQTGLWYRRLGEYEAMQTNLATLRSIARSASEPAVAEAAGILAQSIENWLGAVSPHLGKSIPTLALSAHNARRKLA